MDDPAELQKLLEIDGDKLARLLGTTESVVRSWRTGAAEPDESALKRLRNTLRIVTVVRGFAPPQEVVRWLETPDPDLNDKPPIDLPGSDYATGLLEDYVRQIVNGAH